MIRFQPKSATGDEGAAARLLRTAHIFSSVVREILERRYLQEVAEAPVSLPHLHLLKLIALNGDHFVGHVAEFLGVSAPAASKTVDKLVRLGFLTRTVSEADRRAVALRITPAGRKLVEAYEKRRLSGLGGILGDFKKQEVEQLSSLLERVATALIVGESEDDGSCLRCGAYYQERCPVRAARGFCPYEQVRGTAPA